MTDLIDTTEMYLRTILELEEEGVPPLRARISERLGHSGPTVSQTVGRMERDGLVVVTPDRKLQFTPEGRERAVQVMRKHRLAERLLSDVIGLEWEFVHEEACRWEHVMSEQVERKLLRVLGNPSESPYGNPIPGLAELGAPEVSHETHTVPAHTLASPQPMRVRIRRLAEPAQVDPELLVQLARSGVIPGNEVTISEEGEYVRFATQDAHESLELLPEVAAYVFVEHI